MIKINSFSKSAIALSTLIACGFSASAIAGPFQTSKAFDLTVGAGSTYNAAADTITGGVVSAPFGASTVQELRDQITDSGLKQVNANYSATGSAVIRAGYRGLPIVLSSTNNSTAVSLNIPSIGLAKTFSSKTNRDDNTKDLFDYLKSTGEDVLNQLQQKLAEKSPIDPIAGNPASMQTRMVMDDFDRSFTQFASNIKASSADQSSAPGLIGPGLSLGTVSSGGISTNSTTLPLSYTIRNDLDPRKQWSFHLPLTTSDTAGGKSYGGSLGVAYRFPVNDEWALMPSVSYGITGSADLGAAAAMLAASVTSQYMMRMDGYDLAFGNMIGMYQSSKLSAGDYAVDPKINNTVFRNGVMASFPTDAFGTRAAIEVSFILTNFTGTALYSNQYQELGVTLGTNKSANAARTYYRAGLTYLSGENGITGARLNFGYWF